MKVVQKRSGEEQGPPYDVIGGGIDVTGANKSGGYQAKNKRSGSGS